VQTPLVQLEILVPHEDRRDPHVADEERDPSRCDEQQDDRALDLPYEENQESRRVGDVDEIGTVTFESRPRFLLGEAGIRMHAELGQDARGMRREAAVRCISVQAMRPGREVETNQATPSVAALVRS
jgi:hypothetical protein